MRFLILLAAMALLAVVVVLLLYAVRGGGDKAAAPGTGWEAASESAHGVTTIIVRQVEGPGGAERQRQIITTIRDDDPEWEPRYHEAMAQARSRVAALESQAD